MPEQQPDQLDGRQLPAPHPEPAPGEEITLVLMVDEDAPPPAGVPIATPALASQPRAPRPEPTTTMEVLVPQALADELKQALAVLPGLTLDALASEALVQVLEQHGAPRWVHRRRGDDSLVVLV